MEEKNAKWNTPYLFTGKELDKETGLYYFGARYQDPKLGIFISVDPLAEKFKGWSSYAYAFNNPVRFIDPDGMEGTESPIYDSKTGKYLGVDTEGFLRGEVLFMNADKYRELSNNGEKRIDHNDAVNNSTSMSKLPNTEEGMDLFYKANNHIVRTMDKWFYDHNPNPNLLGGDVKAFSNELGIGTKGSNPKGYSSDTIGQNDSISWDSLNPGNRVDRVAMNFDYRNLINTAPNIFSLFEHEFYGHGLNGWRNEIGGNKDPHKNVYNLQVNTINFLRYASGEYKKVTLRKNKAHGN